MRSRLKLGLTETVVVVQRLGKLHFILFIAFKKKNSSYSSDPKVDLAHLLATRDQELRTLQLRSLLMVQPAGNSRWLRGKVKVVSSGDTLVIMGFTKAEIPHENTVVLGHLSAPRLAHQGGQYDPFAWDSREFLRSIGKCFH
ncbi:hypothetical protein L1987_12787 [Smallanthus sonchifolius]|uniref:Uncharacterized protein n=1 Tax=Smallanthus sonchifolius TaxID=185202 RepID=A0ACB9JGU5_9ASTR|nr:hypothetical protein L1987_12787 [Smallanthus sonchifolius]